jgi:hypothetical protein
MNIKNYEFLCNTLETHGLGHPAVYDALKTKMELGQEEFELKGLSFKFDNDKIQLAPKFGKGESRGEEGGPFYYLNKIKATFIKESGETLSAEFSLYKQRGFNVREMHNLMNGRPVYKKPNDDEGRWTKLDFSNTNEDGNIRVRNYRDSVTNFSLAREIGKLPITWARGGDKEDTLQELQRGEKVTVTIRQDGKTEKMTVGVAPQIGGLELINSNMEVVKRTNTYAMEMVADEDLTQGNTKTQTTDQTQQGKIPETTKQLMDKINDPNKQGLGKGQGQRKAS